ncbi:MAG TPA: hypothetical protein VMT91_04455, partial [Anaerolineales bacterium]|nr:hypothetical protein [Anaerolineales bacterium]
MERYPHCTIWGRPEAQAGRVPKVPSVIVMCAPAIFIWGIIFFVSIFFVGDNLAMAMKPKIKSITLLDFYRLFLGLAILEGFLALWFFFRIPSETRNAFLVNFSWQRIGIGFVFIVVLGVFLFSFLDSFKSQKFLKFLTSRFAIVLDYDINHTLIKTSLMLILICSLAGILFYWFPDLQRLIFFLPNNYIFTVLGERAGLLIGWVFLISLQILILYAISGRKASH